MIALFYIAICNDMVEDIRVDQGQLDYQINTNGIQPVVQSSLGFIIMKLWKIVFLSFQLCFGMSNTETIMF